MRTLLRFFCMFVFFLASCKNKRARRVQQTQHKKQIQRFVIRRFCRRMSAKNEKTCAALRTLPTRAATTASSSPRSGNFVFVYGSLRPDDDSGMPWTREAVKDMQGQRAVLLNAKLYWDEYAAVVLQDSSPDEALVHGWVLSSNNDTLFAKKMAHFDAIEGVDAGLYQKSKAVARLLEPSTKNLVDDQPLGAFGELFDVYCYHKPDCDKTFWIESGDWLKRPR